MKIKKYLCLFFLLFSPLIFALPKISVSYGETFDGFSRVKIKNETLVPLACFVAIDGHKTKFQLRARSTSDWFTSTDTRFNYQNFSTWCDYLDIHPEYKAYKLY